METDYDVQKIDRRISLGRAYLAGPMTGIPQFNFPLFDAVAHDLRVAGWDIVSPAELDDPETRAAALASEDGNPGDSALNGETWADFLARDVKLIADEVDAVILLPGWEASKGARLEAFIASLSGHKVYFHEPACEIGVQEVPEARLHALLHAAATNRPLAARYAAARRLPGLPDDTAGEVRVTDPTTGGEKGRKPERMDLIPPAPLLELGRVYAFGSEKYADWNYAKGYAFSLSLGALLRHVMAWADGEDTDPESGRHHLAHAAWHCFALQTFQLYGLGTDDRISAAVAGHETGARS